MPVASSRTGGLPRHLRDVQWKVGARGEDLGGADCCRRLGGPRQRGIQRPLTNDRVRRT